MTTHGAHSFWLGFNNVRMGKIAAELTTHEIESRFPQVDSVAFAQGVIDGLANDRSRYIDVREHLLNAEVIGVCGE